MAIPAAHANLDPAIPFRASSTHHHHTWARTFHSHPELYIRPQSLPEIQKAINLARRCRRRLVVVGCGHSPNDLTCTSAWMMNLDAFDAVLSVDEATCRVRVQAGIRLCDLIERMKPHGLMMPNLGSIAEQSIAGAIATATHGSSMKHGPLSQAVRSLTVVLASGEVVRCSPEEREELYRAALVSLGAVGVIAEVEWEMIRECNIEWEQDLVPLDEILMRWERGLWTQAEFVRCWWLPYQKKMILWNADKTEKPVRPPKEGWLYGSFVGYYTYHTLLWISHYFPRITPTVEWFVFGMQFGFGTGPIASGVADQSSGLLLDCLYSQFVNEWGLPLDKGPEAITRLSKWIAGDEEGAKIPVSSKGVWVHCPIEVRVSDGSKTKSRAYLDTTRADGPTLYINAILYRPYGLDPLCRDKYYEAFEYLMKDLGGVPHWAKNIHTVTHADLQTMYGENLSSFTKVRNELDPEGLFLGQWHRKYLLHEDTPYFPMEEKEVYRSHAKKLGGGVEWTGEQAAKNAASASSSDESFDVLGGSDTEENRLLAELKSEAASSDN